MKNKKIYGIIAALITLLFPYIVMQSNTNHRLETAQSLCPLKMLSGFPCPGCGITKSMVFCYEGAFSKSISYHLFGPLLIIFCVFLIILLIIELLFKQEYCNFLFYNKKLGIAIALFLAVYHIIRLFYFVKNNNIEAIFKQSIWR